MKRKRRSSRRKNDGGKGVFRNCCIACALAAALSLAITSGGDESFDEHSAEIGSISETQSAAAAEERSAGAVEKIAGISEFGLGSSVITVSVKGEPVRMELEDYIVGVVAAEMPASSEPAALQAQAVAARTFTALHMAGGATCSHRSEGCTVCDDPACCQAYLCCAELEAAWGGSYSEKIAKIRAAVDSTRGMVVLYQGKPISALYHASSGRATENSEAVFAMALPYLVSVDSREGDNSKISMQEFDAESRQPHLPCGRKGLRMFEERLSSQPIRLVFGVFRGFVVENFASGCVEPRRNRKADVVAGELS